jgi:hypothetical protein
MPELPIDRFWPVARDKPGLLTAMMWELAGDSRISFEGNLSRCVFAPSTQPSSEEAPSLRRQTVWPKEDFVVLPLPFESVRPILDVILPDNRYLDDIVHIQIEKDGQLQFGSYDQFHPDCIVGFPPGVTPDLLKRLQSSGLIRSWSVPHEGANRGGHG